MSRFFVATLALAALSAVAQSAPQTSAADDQIVVTAARTPVARHEVGSALTVLDSDDIERRQARYLTDLLRAVPGFAVSHAGVAGSQTQVRVRGAEANHVLVLIDGVRANDPATGDEFRWEFLTTDNIERVEIVRGPQSALWGSDAVAAVVHVITKTGNGAPGGGGYLETGAENTSNGALRGGFGGQHWSLGLGVERLQTDGSNISRTGDERDDSNVTNATLNASWRASDKVELKFNAQTIDAFAQLDPIDFATGLPGDADVAAETRQNVARLSAAIGAPGQRLQHTVAMRFYESSNDNLADGVWDSSTAADRLMLSWQSDIHMGDNLLALALEHEETRFRQRGAIGFGDPNQDQQIDVSSFIADFQGRAAENLTWMLSARYDGNSDFDDALTGRVSAAWQLSDVTTLRANVGIGQKNPTFVERFGFYPGQFVGNDQLQPEFSTSYDIGVEQNFLSSAAALQLSLYQQDLEDEINGFVFDPDLGLFTADNMPGKSKRRGVELTARWAITAALQIGGSYTYTDATEPVVDGDAVQELRRPRHSGSLDVDYRLLDDRARLSLAANYGGNRSDVFFPPWPQPSEIVTLSNYWLVDLTAAYELTSVMRLFVRGSNLLDDDYEQVYGYRTPGRAAYAGIKVDF
ncbi:MAG: TonB-dependent receptor [Woeseiaceae bacterium]